MIPHPDREDQQCHWKVWEELEPESEIMVKTSSSGKLYQCSVEHKHRNDVTSEIRNRTFILNC